MPELSGERRPIAKKTFSDIVLKLDLKNWNKHIINNNMIF